MMLMEAYSKLQRENLRLQAKVLRMEDASGKVSQLEELNAKLKKVLQWLYILAQVLLAGPGSLCLPASVVYIS